MSNITEKSFVSPLPISSVASIVFVSVIAIGSFPRSLTAAPEPIPGGRVAEEADRAALIIADSLDALPTPEVIGRARERLDKIRDDVRGIEKELRLAIETENSPEEFTSITSKIRLGMDQLGALNGQAARDLQDLDESRTRLEHLGKRWEATADLLRKERSPGALRERARKVDDSVAAALSRLRERRNGWLSVQARSADLSEDLRAAKRKIDAARGEQRALLFTANLSPLWKATAIERPARQLSLATARESFLADSLEFYKENRRSIPLHVLMALGIVSGFFFLLATSSGFSRFEIFHLAIFTALLLAPAIYSVFPGLTARLGWIVLVIGGLPLLRRERPRLLASGLILIALMIAALARQTLLTTGTPLERGLLLVESTIMAALILLTFSWSLRLDPLHKPWLHRLIVVLRAMALAPLLAILCESLGFGRLSRYIADGVLFALRLGFVIFSVSLALSELLPVIAMNVPYRFSNFLAKRMPDFGTASRLILLWLGLPVWTYFMLGYLDLRSGLWELFGSIFGWGIKGGSLQVTIGDLSLFALLVWLSFRFSRLLRDILAEDVFPRSSLPRGVPYAISSLMHYLILLIGLAVALTAAGFELSRLVIIGGALGVGIGFGLQNVVNNFVSGIILLFERPVQIGDYIQMDELIGEVRSIGLRSSMIRLVDGSEVIIPNSHLISEKVTNWTLSDSVRRIDIRVGVAYGTNAEAVIEILERIARNHPDIIDDPEPVPLFVGFGDSALDFRLLAWTKKFKERMRVASQMRVSILRELNEAGITIPFPQRDVHLYTHDGGAERGPD